MTSAAVQQRAGLGGFLPPVPRVEVPEVAGLGDRLAALSSAVGPVAELFAGLGPRPDATPAERRLWESVNQHPEGVSVRLRQLARRAGLTWAATSRLTVSELIAAIALRVAVELDLSGDALREPLARVLDRALRVAQAPAVVTAPPDHRPPPASDPGRLARVLVAAPGAPGTAAPSQAAA